MSQPTVVALWEHFTPLTDPRVERSRLHNLLDILALTICAVLAGADNWAEVERYGRRKYDWLKTFLALPNGIPSHDTIGRVFALLDPAAFQRCFLSWVGAVAEASDGQQAIEKANEFKPDVAILDFSMPKRNGLEAARSSETCHRPRY